MWCARPRSHEEVFAAVGRHPNGAGGFDDEAAERIEELARAPARRRRRRDRARLLPRPRRPARTSGGPSRPRSRSRGAQASRSSSTSATRMDPRTRVSEAFATLANEGDGVAVILHCFSAGRAGRSGPAERGWYCSFAGNLTYPKAETIREAAALVPEDLLLVETDSPFLAPQPVRGKPNQPANVVATAERLAEIRGVSYGDLERPWRRTPRASSGGDRLASAGALVAPARPELPRRPQPARRDRPRGRARSGRRRPRGRGRRRARSPSGWRPPSRCLHVIEVDERLRDALEPLARAAGNVERRLGRRDAGRAGGIWPRSDQDGRQPAVLDRHPAADPDDPRAPRGRGAGW